MQELCFGLLNWSLYLTLYGISRGGIGFGDVRLALPIGMYIGRDDSSFENLMFCNLMGWIAAGIIQLIRGYVFKQGSSGRTAFAPYLFLTAGIGFLVN